MPKQFLLNASAVKRYIMERASRTRGAEFTGVSAATLQLLNARLTAIIDQTLPHVPSRTKLVRFDDVWC